MAAESLILRQGVASGVSVSVINLIDRRDSASTETQEWVFQREVEAALYGNGYSQQTGAVYRLLQRSGVGSRSLPLKKACIQQGLVTQDEFDWMYSHLSDVRSFTLIPIDALRTALSMFGRDAWSEELVVALGMERPDGWEEDEEDEEGEEEEEDEEGEEDEEDEGEEDSDDDEEEEKDSDGGASIAPTEVMDEREEDIASGGEAAEDTPPPPVSAPQHTDSGRAAKRQQVEKEKSPIHDVSPALALELEGFDSYRSTPLNVNRKGGSVVQATRESDTARILRFLAWLNTTFKFKTLPTLTIFAHSKVGAAAQRYIKELVETNGRKYSYAAKMAASFVIAAKFVAARQTAAAVSMTADGTPVAQLTALHNQCRQQARQDDQFDVGGDKPAAWLNWDAVQRVRVAAETALSTAKTKAEKLKLTRDVTVLRLLADQPPDRVGVVRSLKLGGTLKRNPDGQYELDLSEPGAHKTSAVFGATRTSVNDSITPWLDRYIMLADIPEGSFLFHTRGDKSVAIAPSAWTERIKATFARHGDVALCPKDARSSFITFLRSGDHNDEVVKAAAVAMRHSSKMQASATYDKGGSDRRVSAAMKVAADYSAKFSSNATASTASSSTDKP